MSKSSEDRIKEDSIKIKNFISKAKTAFRQRNAIGTAIHLANAMNIDPNNKQALEFIEEIKQQLTTEGFTNFKKVLLEGIQTVGTTLRDRGVVEESAFTRKGNKSAGLITGYLGTETASGETFILKALKKSLYSPNPEERRNRVDNIRELIAGDFFQFLLFRKASTVALVQSTKLGELHIRSKFLPNVTSLNDYTKGNKQNNLKNLKGFEKMMAACSIMSEQDAHQGNLMVRSMNDETEAVEVLKIDHGRSLSLFPKTFKNYIDNLLTQWYGGDEKRRDLYRKHIMSGNLTFNLHEYSDILNEMISRMSEDTIKNIVNKKIDELKKAGFEPDGYGGLDERFKIMREDFTNSLQTHIGNMRNYAKKIEKISEDSKRLANELTEGSDEKDKLTRFDNGEWLLDLSTVLKNSPQETIDIKKLMGAARRVEWDQNKIDEFFRIINIKSNESEDPQKIKNQQNAKIQEIERFMTENPTFFIEKYKNSSGESILTKLASNPNGLPYLQIIFDGTQSIEDINTRDAGNQTLLMRAIDNIAEYPRVPVNLIQFLIKKGADPNIQDDDGNTALMRYLKKVKEGHFNLDVIKALIDPLPDIRLTNKAGHSIIDILKEELNNDSHSPNMIEDLESILKMIQSPAPSVKPEKIKQKAEELQGTGIQKIPSQEFQFKKDLLFSQSTMPVESKEEKEGFEKNLKSAILNYSLKISRKHIKYYTLDKFIDFCKETKPPVDLTFIKELNINNRRELESKFRSIVDPIKEEGYSYRIRKFSSNLANLIDGFAQLILEIRGKSRKQKLQKLDTRSEFNDFITEIKDIKDIKKHRPT